jgi:hypothetical protein
MPLLKDWLETRWKFALLAALFAFVLAQREARAGDPDGGIARLLNMFSLIWIFVSVMLAGTGIKTQSGSAFHPAKGLHGSMYFTLSLPVSRLRLLAMRSATGLLESAVIMLVVPCAAWMVVPPLRASASLTDALAYALTTFVCTLGFYFTSVLMALFFDGIWQAYGSVIVIGLLRWLSSLLPVPRSLDFFRAVGDSSPLITHVIPWAAMGVSLVFATILAVATAREVVTHEF